MRLQVSEHSGTVLPLCESVLAVMAGRPVLNPKEVLASDMTGREGYPHRVAPQCMASLPSEH